jgi:hypothetical protein
MMICPRKTLPGKNWSSFVSPATFYRWKPKFCGMDVSEAQRLRQMEEKGGWSLPA